MPDAWAGRVADLLNSRSIASAKVRESDRYDPRAARIGAVLDLKLGDLALRKRIFAIFVRHGMILAEFDAPETDFPGSIASGRTCLPLTIHHNPGLITNMASVATGSFLAFRRSSLS